jgi:hypothetical protein
MPEDFETFLRLWIAENVPHQGERADPAYLDHIVRRSADELIDAAAVEGFYGELSQAAKPYGGVAGFVRSKFETTSRGS